MLQAIHKLMHEIDSRADGHVYGAWLYGSVVLDDFQQGWSDIDFVALIDGPVSESQAEKLLMLRQDMLIAEPDNPYYRSFEGIIANLYEYRSRSFQRLVCWGTSGQRVTDQYTPDVFSLFELAKYSVPVYGEKAWILPMPGREELVNAVRGHYDAIRKYAVETNESLYSCGWLLDIARCIYTLRQNDVISKTQAGFWALEEHLFSDEAPLRKALEIRQNPSSFKDRADIILWLKELGTLLRALSQAKAPERALLQ